MIIKLECFVEVNTLCIFERRWNIWQNMEEEKKEICKYKKNRIYATVTIQIVMPICIFIKIKIKQSFCNKQSLIRNTEIFKWNKISKSIILTFS